jgi:UDP-3-O-[3-hydroxymyristoyl] glucosamine N-acyltransferase
MAGQVGVADHLTIGDRTTLLAQTGLSNDVPADSKMLGSPAMAYKAYLRNMHELDKVADLRKDVKQIKNHLGLEEDAA